MNRQQTLELLERHGIIPTRSLGQNFLVDDRVVDRICSAAELGPEDLVIEIGPGIGGLTRELAARAGRVIAIEIDRHVLPALNESLSNFSNCTVIHADALDTDFHVLAWSWPGPVKICANLPYYITTPLLVKSMIELPACSQMVIMIQKEAAARVIAGPGTKQYGPLAVLAACFGKPQRELIVPAAAFFPRPGVDSCVIRIDASSRMNIQAWADFKKFLENCFAQRRKTIANSLRIAGMAPEKLARLVDCLAEMGFGPDIRAEALKPAQLLNLFQLLGQ